MSGTLVGGTSLGLRPRTPGVYSLSLWKVAGCVDGVSLEARDRGDSNM